MGTFRERKNFGTSNEWKCIEKQILNIILYLLN